MKRHESDCGKPSVLAWVRLAVGLFVLAAVASTAARAAEPWITTWAATPAPRWAEELPAPFGVPEVLDNQTVRQIARISVGGDQLRVVISNEFGARLLRIGSASVALSASGSAIDLETVKALSFGGRSWAVIPPGAPLVSDPVDLPLRRYPALQSASICPSGPVWDPWHWDGVQTGYISGPGDMTQAGDFKAETTTKSRILLSRILTNAQPDSSAIVFFGDSITDGNCSTPDTNNRWPTTSRCTRTARSRISALATRFEVAGLLGLTEGAHTVQT